MNNVIKKNIINFSAFRSPYVAHTELQISRRGRKTEELRYFCSTLKQKGSPDLNSFFPMYIIPFRKTILKLNIIRGVVFCRLFLTFQVEMKTVNQHDEPSLNNFTLGEWHSSFRQS